MRIPCPFCGSRDFAEFVCRGEIADDLHLRANPAGKLAEHWYHAQGCRNWLTVERDTRTHEILGAAFAQGAR
ncbi:MAG: sarcosine oxidase subunit delta [Sphingomonas sp.]